MRDETLAQVLARQKQEHRATYEALAQWLGVDALKKLVPFSGNQIRAALASGDEHLNGWHNAPWDRKHGFEPNGPNPGHSAGGTQSLTRKCAHCGQEIRPPLADRTAGVWGLVRAAIQRDKEAGRTPLRRAWSLSDTVCVLKHVARYYVA